MGLLNATRDHYTLLIGHMLIDEQMCRDCCVSIEAEWFTLPEVGGDYWHSTAFSTIKQFWDQFHQLMDPASFQIGIYDLLQRFVSPTEPYFVQFQQQTTFFTQQFMPTVNATSRPLAAEVLKYLVNKCRYDAELRSLLDEANQLTQVSTAASAAALSGLGHKLMDVEKRRAASFQGASRQGIMQRQETLPRTKTGIPFIDARFGGGKGPCRRSVAGIIMPQGGGKTTLGNMFAVTQALMGRPSMIVIAEQGFDMDYQRNIWACATGIPTPIFEDNGDDPVAAAKAAGMSPDETMSRLETVDKNLRWVDLIEHDGRIEVFEDEITRLAESSTDRPLEVVYVDWASAIGQMMVGQGYRGRRFTEVYDAITVLGQSVQELAARNDLFLAISQQMSAEAAGASPYKENNEYCALDNRMFTAQFRYCLVVNKKCPKTKLQIAAVPKARNDPTYIGSDRWVLRLNGACARFDEADDYAVKPGRIVSSKHKDGGNSVPQE
jgi:hypothetical protein